MPRRRGDRSRTRPAGEARARAWQSMRVMRRFTSAQVEATAEIASDNLKRYMRGLVAGGYLRIDVPRVSGRPGSFNVYLLVRNTGPRSPILWTDGRVYDPNDDEIYGESKSQRQSVGIRDVLAFVRKRLRTMRFRLRRRKPGAETKMKGSELGV